jgi:competence protein ComEC
MILTHPDMDHVGGAWAILEDFPVLAVMDPGEAAGTGIYLDVLSAAQTGEIPWRVASAGDSLDLDGMALRVLAPEGSGASHGEDGANGASLVLELRFGAFSALLTGDAPVSSEIRFLPRILSPRIQLLKVGHHGSSTSTATALLQRIRPRLALISAGRRNRYGHPHRDVLERLGEAGTRILRTDRDGILVVRGRRDGSFRIVRPRKSP